MLSFLSNKIDAIRARPPEAERVAFLYEQNFAHRGLHDGMYDGPILENSLNAFEAAIAGGYGMECDVQPSDNGNAMVFHDSSLDRLTHASGKIYEQRIDMLRSTALKGDNGTIPTLEELLAMVANRQPILIEIKSDVQNFAPLCLSVRRALEGYRGKAAIMSFNPAIVRWFRKNAPHVVRGLVITEEGTRNLRGRAKRHSALWLAKPDFLAYDIRDLPSIFAANQRKRGIPVLTWTVRSAAHEQIASAHTDSMIFETYHNVHG